MKDTADVYAVAAASKTARTNIERTIVRGVTADCYQPHVEYVGDDPTPLWGITAGNAASYGDDIDEGDLFLFYTGLDYETSPQTEERWYTYLATVQDTAESQTLGREIWDQDEKPWLCIIFLSDVKRVRISSGHLHDELGYKDDHVQNFRRITEKRIEPHIRQQTPRAYLRSKTNVYESVTHDDPFDCSTQNTQSTLEDAGDGDTEADTEVRSTGDIETPDREIHDPDASVDNAPPTTYRTEVTRTVRDTAMTKEIKREHDYTCQLCREQRRGRDGRKYAEGHHLHPLGADEPGPDIEENIVILCPNHHSDFDYGLVRIDPKTYEITHAYEDFEDKTLRTVDGHTLDPVFLKYNNAHVAEF